MPDAKEYPENVYAAFTERDGVHNCPKCYRLVTWGETINRNRARFDFPATADGYVNHHLSCGRKEGRSG